MTISYGWKCPQCNTVHAPTVTTCGKCAAPEEKKPSGFRPIGTASLEWNAGWGGYGTLSSVGGTVFMSPSPPPLTYREQRADKAIKDWRGGTGSWKELRTLIVRAADEIVEHECEGCEDDDE